MTKRSFFGKNLITTAHFRCYRSGPPSKDTRYESPFLCCAASTRRSKHATRTHPFNEPQSAVAAAAAARLISAGLLWLMASRRSVGCYFFTVVFSILGTPALVIVTGTHRPPVWPFLRLVQMISTENYYGHGRRS